MIDSLNELLEFIRFKICIFAPFLGITGYLLFNSLSTNIIFVALACFFVCIGVYSYNNITDKEEDLINEKPINTFVTSNKGYFVVIISFLCGTFFLFFLSFYSILVYVSSIITGLVYSFFRLKRHLLVKNFYTGFGITQLFLLGAVNGNFSVEIVLYYLLISIFFFSGTLISDLRDYKGDKYAGIKTLPIFLGYVHVKRIIYILLSILSIIILTSNLYNLFILLPFSLLMIFFLSKNKVNIAHWCGGIPFIFLALWLFVSV